MSGRIAVRKDARLTDLTGGFIEDFERCYQEQVTDLAAYGFAQEMVELIYFDEWIAYGYDQDEGFAYVNRPERIDDADPYTCIRLLVFVHRMDYWMHDIGGEAWREVTLNGFVFRVLSRLNEFVDERAPNHLSDRSCLDDLR